MQGAPPPEGQRVVRDNWNQYPFSLWSFQHARRLFRSRPVAASVSPRALDAHPHDLSALKVSHGDGAVMDWAQYLTQTHTDAFVVLKGGRVVYDYYARDMTPQTPHMVFSITKSLTGLLAEILHHEGRIDLGAQVKTYVPELDQGAYGEVLLRHVMDMTDGVDLDETYANPDSDIHRYSAAYWGPKKGHVNNGGVYDVLPGVTRRKTPAGTAFKYKTPSGDVLGWAMQRATGQSLGDMIEARIWQAIGARDEAYMIIDGAGQEIAATGFNATALDIARLGQVMVDGGRINDKVVIAPQPIEALFAGGDRDIFAQAGIATRPGWSYRSQWWHTHNAHNAICALGVYGQRLYVDLTNRLVIVRFGSSPVADNTTTDNVHRAAFDTITAYFGQ
jgi:hypothetical protein